MTIGAALSVTLSAAWSSLRIVARCGILALPVDRQSRDPRPVNRHVIRNCVIVCEEPRHE